MKFLTALPLFIAIFILIAIIFIIFRKSNKGSSEYDERQLIARNMAYKWAFIVLASYFFASEMITIISGIEWCTPECNIGLGLLVSIGTFATISVIKDAYTPIGGNIANSILIFLLLGGYQLFSGISDIFEKGIMNGNLLNLPLAFCIGLLFVVILTAQLIKLAIDRKSDKEEE